MQPSRLQPISTGCYHSLLLLHPIKFLETVCGKEKNPLPTKSCVPVSSSTTVPQTQEHWSKETKVDAAVSSTRGYHEVSCSFTQLSLASLYNMMTL